MRVYTEWAEITGTSSVVRYLDTRVVAYKHAAFLRSGVLPTVTQCTLEYSAICMTVCGYQPLNGTLTSDSSISTEKYNAMQCNTLLLPMQIIGVC